jgi:hypothetical protein
MRRRLIVELKEGLTEQVVGPLRVKAKAGLRAMWELPVKILELVLVWRRK